VVLRRLEDSSPFWELTPREREVLSEVAAGLSNAAIARSFGVSKRAVERHIAAIFRKSDLLVSDDESRRVAVTLLYLRSRRASTRAAGLTDDARALRAEARLAVLRKTQAL
jgi:DNA-binding NarL/FixJ family response regulator